MALNYVELTCDLYDGEGNVITAGSASFVPSAQLTDTSDHELIVQAPVVVVFRAAGSPVVRLLATDNGVLAPSGWGWTVTFTGVPGNPAGFSFFLPYASGATQNLSSQAPVSSVVTMAAYLPIDYPTGAASGYVWTSDMNGNGSWQPSTGGGGGMTNPMTTLGDIIYENATPAAARLAGNATSTRKFLRQTGTGSVSAAPAWDTLVAGDVPTLNQNTTGTAAGLSSTLAIGSGGTGQTTQQAAIDALAGAQTSGQFLRGNGTHVLLAAIQAADLPTLAAYLQVSNNLSDLSSAATARTNLGLGSAATAAIDTTAGDIQPTGTAAAAGSTGKVADAGHVHTGVQLAGDLGNTNASPQVTATHLASPLPIAQGGTGTATGAPQNDVFAGPTSGTGAPAFRALVAADLPAGTTGAKGALQLDGTAADIQPAGAQAAGASGLAADAKHVHQDLNLYLCPANTLAYTMPAHTLLNSVAPFTTGGQVMATAIPLTAGLVIGHIQIITATTAANGPQHFWIGIADSTITVRAVSTDNGSGAMAANTAFSFAVTTDGTHAYTVPSTGLYYIVASASATTAVPSLLGASSVTGVNALLPAQTGTAGTQAGPPTVGSQLNSGTVTAAAIHVAAWCLT